MKLYAYTVDSCDYKYIIYHSCDFNYYYHISTYIILYLVI